MDAADPGWDLAVVLSKINLYYFTGTMQDGMLLVPRDGEACLWVRRSFERAEDESLFPAIRPMRSYRDAAASMDADPGDRVTSRPSRCRSRSISACRSTSRSGMCGRSTG